jgi:hypothetical protein
MIYGLDVINSLSRAPRNSLSRVFVTPRYGYAAFLQLTRVLAVLAAISREENLRYF